MFPDTIEQWHQAARPEPEYRDLQTQLGCHLEEIIEMLDTIQFEQAVQQAIKLLQKSLEVNHASR